MHPLFRRRLRPISAVVLVFFTWFAIEPWNFAQAAQNPPNPLTSNSLKSQNKIQTTPESASNGFEETLRAIKGQVRSFREGKDYQEQLKERLEGFRKAAEQGALALELTRQGMDRLARTMEQGKPAEEAIKGLETQSQKLAETIGQIRLENVAIEGMLRGMALPSKLSQDHRQAKESFFSLAKDMDVKLKEIIKEVKRQGEFDQKVHAAFLEVTVEVGHGITALEESLKSMTREVTPERRRAQLLEEVLAKHDGLTTADREIRGEFAQTEAFLKERGLSQVILDRHNKAVQDYEKNFSQLQEYLGQVEQAQQAFQSATQKGDQKATQAKEQELESRLADLGKFLKENVKDPPHQSLDPNNLPHRTPKVKERKPRLKKEEFAEFQQPIRLVFNGDPSALLVAQSTQDLPKPEDLAQTIEVQFTSELQQIATLLENDPVLLYEFVRNNFVYETYYGSVKGSQGTLITQAGNDFDQASLLIALYRASGIPARYAYGTIEIPISKAMNWLGGVTKPEVVGQILLTNGIPARLIYSGSVLKAVQLEHAWVEAYLPYTNYRGRVNDPNASKTWVPLDPSFKVHDPNPNALDLAAQQQFDIDSYFNSYLQTVKLTTPAKDYLTNTINYVTANLSGQRFYDLLASGPIVEKVLDLLPNTLPYPVMVIGPRFSICPDTYRHRINLELMSSGSIEVGLSYTAPWATLLHKRFILSYEPATSSDVQTIAAYGGLYSTPPYLIQVKPVLKVEGVTVAQGTAINMASDISLRMSFVGPQGILDDVVINTVTAGADFAIGLDIGYTTGRVVTNHTVKLDAAVTAGESGDPVLGEFLNLLATSYLQELDSSRKMVSRTMKILDTNHVAELMVGVNLTVSYVFGVPKSVSVGGVLIDVDRNIAFPVDMGGDPAKTRRFQVLDGMTASALEHTVFETVIGAESVSAIKALQVASTQGIPLHHVDAGNIETELAVLQLSGEVETDIRNAVQAGKVVTVSERNIQLNNWIGVGYIVLDPTTGAGAYQISGGISGGSLTQATASLQNLINRKQMTLEEAQKMIRDYRRLIWFPAPIDAVITSEFGLRYNPRTGQTVLHKGIDYGALIKTPVKAVAGGTVIKKELSESFGNVVMIDHGAGVTTLYAHNCELLVSIGQQVTEGDIIAKSGNTGRVWYGGQPLPDNTPRCVDNKGAHLHFEIAIGGEQVDPKTFNFSP